MLGDQKGFALDALNEIRAKIEKAFRDYDIPEEWGEDEMRELVFELSRHSRTFEHFSNNRYRAFQADLQFIHIIHKELYEKDAT